MRSFSIALLTVTALVGSLTLSAQPAGAAIDPPPGSTVVLQAKGAGVQIYSCAEPQGTFKWMLKAPDAKLLDESGKQIGTHFAGPTWKLTDGSQVQGELIASRPAPEPNAVPWLLLRSKPGTASGKFAGVAFIQRAETHGGSAPATGCSSPGDLDQSLRVPYSATYTFFAASQR
ncbi:MAG: DUF3455 domain-containing protein [Terracidiphilus sp.]